MTNMEKSHRVIIREAYKDYAPPFDVSKVVDRLLSGVRSDYLVDLKTVVLLNTGNLSKRIRQGTSSKTHRTVGRYHLKSKESPAWIELFVDHLLCGFPHICRRSSFFQDLYIASTLFHEIGHHIHYTKAPQYKEKEDVADVWGRKLNHHYSRRRYWYLIPLGYLLWPVYKLIQMVNKRNPLEGSTRQD